MQKLLTLEEVADTLRLPPEAVEQIIAREELHAIEIRPGIIRVQVTDLKTFLRVRRHDFRPSGSAA